MIDLICEKNPDWLALKEGRDLLRRCHQIVDAGVVLGEVDEAHEAVNKYVGSAGQMISKDSAYWKTHKPKKINQDWIELEKHFQKKRKSMSRPFRDLPGFSDIVIALGGTIRNGKAMCRCPAHADKSPSLSVTEVNGRTLMHCFAGCTFEQILAAMKGMLRNEIS